MKIIADTASLLSPAAGAQLGVAVLPICVMMDGESRREYAEISSADVLERVRAGEILTSSQPALGDVMEALEGADEELLYITVADGISGAYQTAMGARNCIEDNGRIHILNSRTLAGPLNYLVRKAAALKAQGRALDEIIAALEESCAHSLSFTIPEDFDFMKRSGRLTPLAAKIGGALRLLPVLTLSKDKTRIAPLTVKRTWKSAVDAILKHMQEGGVDGEYILSVSHAGAPERAEMVAQRARERLGALETEIFELSPSLIAHGGPGCIVVQAIRK